MPLQTWPVYLSKENPLNKDSLFDAEMFWLTDGDVLFKGLAEEEPASLADVEIAEILADEDGAELWDCNVLVLTGTCWLGLVVTLWDAGPLTVIDREALTDALSENTLGLWVCETVLDALAFWKEAGKKVKASRICHYLDDCKRPEFHRAVLTKYIAEIFFSQHLTNKHTKKEQCGVKWSFFSLTIGRTLQVTI